MKSIDVIDENGTVHTLGRFLGRGGQGEVWLTSSGRRIVKLFERGRDRETLRRQLGFVKRLDLKDLHVARPLAVLQPPHVGYVAEFLADMVPIATLLRPPRDASAGEWHLRTGSLRRRLRLLAHAGEALAGLHARGLIHGDVSHGNVFVSAPVEATEAWLIDADNLRHDSDPASAVFTPGYGAPEVVGGRRGSTSLSDAWSFAVLTFQALALIHPFCGDMVDDGAPELEEEAYMARLPWVDHATDDRNRSSRGLPREAVLGARLSQLARVTFEGGATDPSQRPGLAKWIEHLHTAADQTLRCAGCDGTYFVTAKACTWCDGARPSFGVVRFHRWQPTGKRAGVVPTMGAVGQLPFGSEALTLNRRQTEGATGVAARSDVARLERVDRGFVVRALSQPLFVTPPGSVDASAAVEVTERGRVLPFHEPERSWVLHFGPVDTAHRVAVVTGDGR